MNLDIIPTYVLTTGGAKLHRAIRKAGNKRDKCFDDTKREREREFFSK
jgi:hypothetical protein